MHSIVLCHVCDFKSALSPGLYKDAVSAKSVRLHEHAQYWDRIRL